jgi:hypothetical protein
MILSNENTFIGLKMTFAVITPIPKFLGWRTYVYRIGSRSEQNKERRRCRLEVTVLLTLQRYYSQQAHEMVT